MIVCDGQLSRAIEQKTGRGYKPAYNMNSKRCSFSVPLQYKLHDINLCNYSMTILTTVLAASLGIGSVSAVALDRVISKYASINGVRECRRFCRCAWAMYVSKC